MPLIKARVLFDFGKNKLTKKEKESMSKNGSNREQIFSVFLKENKHILEEIIGAKMDNITLEERYAQRKLDMKAIDTEHRVNVYVESQVTKANLSYLDRVKEMIEKHPEGIIIWIAQDFHEELVRSIEEWIEMKDRRYIDFYALTIAPEVYPVLQQLNELPTHKVYENFHLLKNISKPLNIFKSIKNIPAYYSGESYIGEMQWDFNRAEDVKRALLAELEKQIPYFLNVHFSKRTNQHDHILTFGAGRGGISYRCSAKNRQNQTFVELFFDQSKYDYYLYFVSMANLIREMVHPDIVCHKRKIGVYIGFEDYDSAFKHIADILETMIKFFSPLLYDSEFNLSKQIV